MARKRDLSDSIEQMHFREEMLTNWWQKKFRRFMKQVEEYSPYSEGEADLLEGLCYLNGWGVRKDPEAARKCFSRLRVGNTVWFGRYVSGVFMKCEVIKVEPDRVLLREETPRSMGSYGRALLVPPKEAAPWDCCLARKWMNTDYCGEVFGRHERNQLLKVKVTTPPNPYTDKSVSVKDVEDKVFLLSIQEFLEYKGALHRVLEPVTWTFSQTGPEQYYNRGDYSTRIATREAKYKAMYFGWEVDREGKKLEKTTGSILRTPGTTGEEKAFVVEDYLFYEGEKWKTVKCSDITLAYNPAFWVKLK